MNRIVIQVNGLFCCTASCNDDQLISGDYVEIMSRPEVIARIGDAMPLKFVVVPRKLINIVTSERWPKSRYTLTEHADGTKTCEPPFPTS